MNPIAHDFAFASMSTNVQPDATVKVVMPSLNQAEFIEAAIESVFTQAPTGIALWVQDGGSTDGTQDLLASLRERHSGLVWASEADAGPADALNRGFTRMLASSGTEVIGWLNSDDLFESGALDRARNHLDNNPEHVAVYGEGLHVAVDGTPIGRYPTYAPDRPLARWADGCPVCQPTMWLRPEALRAILPMDTTLHTAFDFDAWLRLFSAFPGRVGHLPTLQARSRLHATGITLTQRRHVALEALQVIHRHLGPAPGHWLLTYADELRRNLPDEEPVPLSSRLAQLLNEAREWLSLESAQEVALRWRNDRSVQIAKPEAVLDVYPDGWLSRLTAMRLRVQGPGTLILSGRHAAPHRESITLRATAPDHSIHITTIRPNGKFLWHIVVRGLVDNGDWRFEATPSFVPTQQTPGKQDLRSLVCQIDDLMWQPSATRSV